MVVGHRLNPYNIVTFYFVAREGSYSLAAEKLCVTQPAVTLQIKSLENSYGTKLIEVRKKRVYLTQAGKVFFHYAEQVYRDLSEAERFLQDKEQRTFYVGMTHNLSSISASIVTRFNELFPDVKLTIKSGISYEIVDELINLEHDLAIVASADYNHPELAVVKVGQVTLELVAARSHPLCSVGKMSLADLGEKNIPLLLCWPGSITRNAILKKLEPFKIPSIIPLETNDFNCMIRLLEMEKGVSFLQRSYVKGDIARERLSILPCEDMIALEVVALTRHTFLSFIESSFVSIVSEQLKESEAL
jgi:DNA-binding transcriptional LysR family regulator